MFMRHRRLKQFDRELWTKNDFDWQSGIIDIFFVRYWMISDFFFEMGFKTYDY